LRYSRAAGEFQTTGTKHPGPEATLCTNRGIEASAVIVDFFRKYKMP